MGGSGVYSLGNAIKTEIKGYKIDKDIYKEIWEELNIKVPDDDFLNDIGKNFIELGFKIVATSGTHKFFKENGIESNEVLKISEGRPNIDDCLKNGDIALVINTSDNRSSKNDAKLIRQTVLRENIPYFTTLSATEATVAALKEMKKHRLEICSLQEYLSE